MNNSLAFIFLMTSASLFSMTSEYKTPSTSPRPILIKKAIDKEKMKKWAQQLKLLHLDCTPPNIPSEPTQNNILND